MTPETLTDIALTLTAAALAIAFFWLYGVLIFAL